MSELWEHQKKAVELASQSQDGFAFFFDPGTGKTRTTIECLRYEYNKQKRIVPTLILCPVIVVKNWKDEFKKFSKVEPKRILALHGPVARRITEFESAVAKYGNEFICITNYDALVREAFFEKLQQFGAEVLIFDESHKIKTHNSKRTKMSHKLADISKKRFLLSGTPILNTPMDVWSQYRALDLGKRFGKSFWSFKNMYFYDANKNTRATFPNWQPNKLLFGKMNELIYEVAMRQEKSKCLDLPPLMQISMKVGMKPDQKKHYLSMKKDFITFLDENEDNASVAQLAVTKSIRLRQILSGFVKTEDGKVHFLKKTEKEEALEELLEEHRGRKVIIWAVFKAEYEIIRRVLDKLKLKFVEATGEVSSTKKYEAVEKFSTSSDTNVFVGHPASLGIGINLTVSDVAIYFSRDWSLEQREQSQARNYRGGSEVHKTITHYDIVVEDSIDEHILESLKDKKSLSETILKLRREL